VHIVDRVMGVKQRHNVPRKASPLKTALLLLGLNIVPVGFGVTVFVLRQQGKITLRELPQESVGTLVLMAAVLLGIVALGWVVFPSLLDLRKAARKRSEGTFGFFFRAIAAFLLLDLVVLFTLVCLLAGAELVLLARFALSLQKT
jgi:hypothetical protein